MELLRPLIPPFSRGVHRAEPRLHVRFRLFLAIFIHSRGQIIRERAAGHLKGKSRFPEEKFGGQRWGKNLDYVSTRVNERAKSSKHGVENRLQRGY